MISTSKSGYLLLDELRLMCIPVSFYRLGFLTSGEMLNVYDLFNKTLNCR